MKSSEIHNGLDRKEIRDFLSKQFVRTFEDEMQNKKVGYPYNKVDPFDYVIKDAEAQIEFLKKQIEIARTKQAIRQLILASGWEEWDVSDETENDLNTRLKMNFIGTKEEHENLLSIIRE